MVNFPGDIQENRGILFYWIQHWLTALRFKVPFDAQQVILETLFSANLLACIEKNEHSIQILTVQTGFTYDNSTVY